VILGVEGMCSDVIVAHPFHVKLTPRSRFHSVVEKIAEIRKHMMCIDRWHDIPYCLYQRTALHDTTRHGVV
jgi:hypothetical protein